MQCGILSLYFYSFPFNLINSFSYRKASNCWTACLNTLLSLSNVGREWRSLIKDKEGIDRGCLEHVLISDAAESLPSVLIKRCGVWGVLFAGQAATAIARYVATFQAAVHILCLTFTPNTHGQLAIWYYMRHKP